ncbi:MAG TPA: biotin/lipoyl-containing protein, partial [Sphingomonas sp.]|nr:biotin/lipoyl-containing protein [Sphingomonas sp.]
WIVRIDEAEHDVTLEADSAVIDGEALSLTLGYKPGATLVEAEVGGEPLALRIARKRGHMLVTTGGRARKVQAMRPAVAALRHHMIEKPAPDMSRFLVSPMPGLLTRLLVGEGDKVEAGQPLATVEAMKMENMLRAEKGAVVAKVAAGVGESLAIDQVILEFE